MQGTGNSQFPVSGFEFRFNYETENSGLKTGLNLCRRVAHVPSVNVSSVTC